MFKSMYIIKYIRVSYKHAAYISMQSFTNYNVLALMAYSTSVSLLFVAVEDQSLLTS